MMSELYASKKIDTVDILNIDDVKLPINKKVVFISGVTGQDGSLMVDYLLESTDHFIIGGVRRLSVYNHQNIKHIVSDRFILVNFDLTDSQTITSVVSKLKPDYFINFAAQSFVASSWDFPRQTWNVNTTGVLDILEAVRRFAPQCRVYQAGSSEEFGNVEYSPQDEKHPLKPRSPYGASKAASRQIIKVYRDSYNLYAIQGWLFNHEGVRRGEEFVTRKITKNIARIHRAISRGETFIPLEMGNINAVRDWSDAEDFVKGVWMMLNQEVYNKDYKGVPSEYVLSSNETHTVREFIETVFSILNIDVKWIGNGINERLVLASKEEVVLCRVNPKFYRPAEVDLLFGNSNRIRDELGWRPETSFQELVRKMIMHDI